MKTLTDFLNESQEDEKVVVACENEKETNESDSKEKETNESKEDEKVEEKEEEVNESAITDFISNLHPMELQLLGGTVIAALAGGASVAWTEIQNKLKKQGKKGADLAEKIDSVK